MATFNDLQADGFYLIEEAKGNDVQLVEVLLVTQKAVLLNQHSDDYETMVWRKKTDTIYEIVEELDATSVTQYEDLFEEEADDDFDEED
ncbi:MAG: hypothetical protein EAZ47_07970 [Bacteroidetes bacterium]|jgi:hypothetical protein|nr:MAG: hypothetical protein EAY72_11880 [Bacteroidota bacterium]TAE68453.1 MAG: hypothetical protein EAY68_04560 [Bacteroidota bacterium]TAF92916.1 MAG: hypothetical protein EAZ47_07970 [Bacteroidota bacterium]